MTPISLDGRWQLVRAEHAGETAPDLVTNKTTLELEAGRYAVSYGGEVVDSGSFEVGAAVDRYTLVLRGTLGPNAGRTIPCIFQLRGDRLRVCYGFDGFAPTDYVTDPGNQRYLGVYRRM